jgi:hypothetical protein
MSSNGSLSATPSLDTWIASVLSGKLQVPTRLIEKTVSDKKEVIEADHPDLGWIEIVTLTN